MFSAAWRGIRRDAFHRIVNRGFHWLPQAAADVATVSAVASQSSRSRKKIKMPPSRSRSRGRPTTPRQTPSKDVVMRSASRLSRRSRSKSRSRSRVSFASTVAGGSNASGILGGKTFGKTRSVKKRKGYKAQAKGACIQVKQASSVISTGSIDTVFLGHATCPGATIKQMIGLAIIKKLMVAIGVNTQAYDEALVGPPFGLTIGDQIQVAFKNFPDLGSASISWTVAAATDSMATFGAWFTDPVRPWNFLVGDNAPFVFEYIRFIPSATSILASRIVRLEEASVTIHVKSALKVQNRTVSVAADNSSEDVNSMPLEGKVYSGYGNAAMWKSNFRPSQTLVGDNTWGIIAYTPPAYSPSTTPTGMNEPPEGIEFKRVTRQGKFVVGPGQIKTSVLTHNFTMKLEKLMGLLVRSSAPAGTLAGRLYDTFSVGKFKFMCFEKILDVDSTQNIVLAWELDSKFTSFLKTRTSYSSLQVFNKVYS